MSRAEYEHFLNFIFHILRSAEGKRKTLSWERVAGRSPDGCGAASRTGSVPPLFRRLRAAPSPRGRSGFSERVKIPSAVDGGEEEGQGHEGQAHRHRNLIHGRKGPGGVPGALFMLAEAPELHGVGDGLDALHGAQNQRNENGTGGLRNEYRKSGGCRLDTLRFYNRFNLLGLCGEERELLTWRIFCQA